MKTTEQYFPVGLFITVYKLVLNFECVDVGTDIVVPLGVAINWYNYSMYRKIPIVIPMSRSWPVSYLKKKKNRRGYICIYLNFICLSIGSNCKSSL